MDYYVLLLRGINVGGNNRIKMQDLRSCLERSGFSNVQTYIQSGNVIVASKLRSSSSVQNKVTKVLQETFDYKNPTLVYSKDQYLSAIRSAPKSFGKLPDKYSYDTIFLLNELKPTALLEEIDLNPSVDTVYAGEGVVFFRRKNAERSKSKMSTLVQSKYYKQLSIRNWKTSQKIVTMLEEAHN